MLLLKEDDGDNDGAADSDVAAASATAPFASAPVVDDETYGSLSLEILREGNLICLTI